MHVSRPTLTKLAAPYNDSPTFYRRWRWLFAAFLIAAYLLPWAVTSTSASLTFNAYDLAEWASLHPGGSNGDASIA
ncbi:hypothetical protein HC928_18210 [bacterium]|nr:hypothetical protein [bacterium]